MPATLISYWMPDQVRCDSFLPVAFRSHNPAHPRQLKR